MKNWKLIKCIYDEIGMRCDEIQDPEEFADNVKNGKYVSWCVVTIMDLKGRKITRIELEGPKENLEFVLKVINDNPKEI